MKALHLTILFEYVVCQTTAKFSTTPISTEDILNLTSKPSEGNTLYLPKWEDLDTRPMPQWYDSAKIGIFIHWGIYSVPGKGEWIWPAMADGNEEISRFIRQKYGERLEYERFAPLFTATSFKPHKWAKLFAKSGAKYVVLTAKHHDGFALFPSRRPLWNSVDTGPRKDIVKLLSNAIRKHDIKFGIHYSLFEWYNPLFMDEKHNGFRTTKYTDNVVWPDIKFLVNNYKPSVLWSDGESDASDTYWKSKELLAWLYNESPVKDEIVANDRWGKDTNCNHGDFYNCKDRYNPRDYSVIRHKWENALSLDRYSWGYREDMKKDVDVLSDFELLEQVVSTVSCAGNILINIGPTKLGTIPPIFKKRLLRLGQWLKVNGEAIYGSSPWHYHRDDLNADVWYTCAKNEYDPLHPANLPAGTDTIKAIFVIFLKWPTDDRLRIKDLTMYMKDEGYVAELIQPQGYLLINHVILLDTVVFDLPTTYNNKSASVLKVSSKNTINLREF